MRLALLLVPITLSAMPLPPGFESNAGQAPPEVIFIARAAGYTALLRAHDIAVGGATIDFEGASPRITGEQQESARITYFRGGMPPEPVHRYGRVRYTGLYPGIDAVFYMANGELEYDLVLAPHADISRVRMRFRHTLELIEDAGDLVLRSRAGEVRQRRPRVFQDGREVGAHYVLHAGGRVGIALARYDRNRPLSVDPTIQVATLYGGAGTDIVTAVAVDAKGYIYIAGSTTSLDLPGARDLIPPLDRPLALNQADAFIAKLTPDGSRLVFAVYIGGAQADAATGVGLDGDGNVYAAGYTFSLRFPTTDGAWIRQHSQNPVADGWLAKLDPSGSTLLYSSYLGSIGGLPGDPSGPSLQVDAAGYAYVAGAATADTFPATPGAFQSKRGGDSDGFVIKMNRAGSAPVFATLVGGSRGDRVIGLALDSAENVYICGSTASLDFPSAEPIPTASQTGFVAKLNSSGSAIVYASLFSGAIASIAVDGSDAPWIVGSSNAADLPLVNPLWPGTSVGSFLAQLDANSADVRMFTWVPLGQASAFVFGPLAHLAAGDGRIYLLVLQLIDSAITGGGIIASAYQNSLAAIDPALGQVIYATRLPGPAVALAPLAGGDVVVAGTASFAFFSTPGAFQSQYAGPQATSYVPGGDAYVVRISPENPKPSLDGVSPEAASALNNVQVAGRGFVAGTQVLWNGNPHPATIQSPNVISLTLASDEWAPGQIIPVAVVNPGPGGGMSEQRSITVLNPQPGTISLSPARVTAGSDDTKILVRAAGVVASSELRWNGVLRATRFVPPSSLELTVPAADLSRPATVVISLSNPAPGGGAASANFAITSADAPGTTAPSITQSVTVALQAADNARAIFVQGFNFISGAVARWGGVERPTQFVSATALRVTLTADDVARPGRVDVTVINPGGATSNTSSGYVYVPDLSGNPVWEPNARRFYAPTTNGVARIDPAAGVERVFPTAGTPELVTVSSDGTSAYVTFRNQALVQRVDLLSAAAADPFNVDPNTQYSNLTQIQIQPSNRASIAIGRSNTDFVIFDAGVPRPYDSTAAGFNGGTGPFYLTDSALWIQGWFYYGNDRPGNTCLGRMSLDQYGISGYKAVCDAALAAQPEIRHVGSVWTFMQNGQADVFHADGPWQSSQFIQTQSIAVNFQKRRIYAIVGPFSSLATLFAYDLDSLAVLWSVPIPGFSRLLTWGSVGIEVFDGQRMFLFEDTY